MQSKPDITELTDPTEILECFRLLKEDAVQRNSAFVESAKRNRTFLNESQYLKRGPGGYEIYEPHDNVRHIPRTEAKELRDSLNQSLPLVVRGRPNIKITADNPEEPVDLRVMNDAGELVGEETPYPGAVVAEGMNEVLEIMHQMEGRLILYRLIAEEASIAGRSVIGWRIIDDNKGVRTIPVLLQPDQFMMDPRCQRWWDFADCRYTIECKKLTAAQIYEDYGVLESEYAGSRGADAQITPMDTSYFGMVGAYIDENNKLDYRVHHYNVWTMYYRPKTFTADEEVSGKKVPPLRKYVFIGDYYYASEHTVINPWTHEDFPYIIFQLNPTPFSPWGVSQIRELISTVQSLNILRNNALAGAQISINPPWVGEEDTVLGDIQRGPGGFTKIVKNSTGALERLDVPGIAENTALIQLLKDDMRTSLGDKSGYLVGDNSGARSGVHAAINRDAVLTQYGLQVLMLDPSWTRLHYQDVHNFQQYIDLDRNYVFKQHGFRELALINDAMRNLPFDLEVHSQDGLPTDPIEKDQYWWQKYIAGAIPLQEYYKQSNKNVSPEVLARIEEVAPISSWIPNLPPQVQAEQQVAASLFAQQAQNALAEESQIG